MLLRVSSVLCSPSNGVACVRGLLSCFCCSHSGQRCELEVYLARQNVCQNGGTFVRFQTEPRRKVVSPPVVPCWPPCSAHVATPFGPAARPIHGDPFRSSCVSAIL